MVAIIGPRKLLRHRGSSPEPVPWTALEAIFDALVSPDRHNLNRWPDAPGTVLVTWMDANAVVYTAQQLDDLRVAYETFVTTSIRFTCSGISDGVTSEFEYEPGAQPPIAEASVTGPLDVVEPAIAVVRKAFPLPPGGGIIFLSWSGARSKSIAKALVPILQERLPSAEVFFSATSIDPGDSPQRKMLHDNLRNADALVAVLTQESANRPWVIWETASTWGRSKKVIPLFVDVHPGDVDGPLASEAQGVRHDDREGLDKAFAVLARVVHAAAPPKLDDDEYETIMASARESGDPQGNPLIDAFEKARSGDEHTAEERAEPRSEDAPEVPR